MSDIDFIAILNREYRWWERLLGKNIRDLQRVQAEFLSRVRSQKTRYGWELE